MPAIIKTAAAFLVKWGGRAGIAALVVSEANRAYQASKPQIDQSFTEAAKAGMTKEDLQKLVAATTYDQVEQQGKEPEDFWAGLSPKEKEALQFSPASLQGDIGRTKFLGLSSALLFIGSLAAGGYAAKVGIPIALSTVAKLRAGRVAGLSSMQLMAIFEEGKLLGLAKVWVPGFIAGIAGAAGWLTMSMTNNLNDATLWGRIFLGQAADDFEKVQTQKSGTIKSASGGSSFAATPRTIIRMVEEKEPAQFIGTLFSSKLGNMLSFDRHVDTEITNEADLVEDVKINLNKWLATLPGRLGYSIVIRKDPVDHTGVKQSGLWATLTTHFTRLSGPIQPIDTILLGPVTPRTRLELTKAIKTIETQIPELLSAQTVREIEIPSGSVDIFDEVGERVTLATPQPLAVATVEPPAPPPIETPGPTEEQLKARITPVAVAVRFPLDGIFKAVGDFGQGLYKRDGNTLHDIDLLNTLLDDDRGKFGNAGGQAVEALRILKTTYNIDWDMLPQFNIGDLQHDRTLDPTLKQSHATFSEWLSIGTNKPANQREEVLNA